MSLCGFLSPRSADMGGSCQYNGGNTVLSGFLSPRSADMEGTCQYKNKQSQTDEKGWSGKELANPRVNKA